MRFNNVLGRMRGSYAPLYLYNTLTRRKDVFELPKIARQVRMYNCGPTVYGPQHIGNLSMFVFTDILRRTLEWNGFAVKQVINITDVGHLSSDSDSGDDKMTLGLLREGLSLSLDNMKILAERYTATFLDNLRALHIDTSRIEFPRASEHIPAQIAMIRTLEEKGYAYRIESGVYFDTSRFPAYGALGGVDLEGLREGARVTPVTGKRHGSDFSLWKLDERIGWDSPWGKGFPGWHIECSAMIRDLLGQQIDIHTGGIEHIPIHHNNEIAQSECATGKTPLSRFWLHRAHVQVDGAKLAKSQGNVIYLSDIVERGFHPLALRYLFLQAHYRAASNFSWEALQAAATAHSRLASHAKGDGGTFPKKYKYRFTQRINDDLDTPGALAVLWDMTKDTKLSSADIAAGIKGADEILGFGLKEPETLKLFVHDTVLVDDLPPEIKLLVAEREQARAKQEWQRADELRGKIREHGYELSDTSAGPSITKLQN